MFKQMAAGLVCLSMLSGMAAVGSAAGQEGESITLVTSSKEEQQAVQQAEPQAVQPPAEKENAASQGEEIIEGPVKIMINLAARSLGVYDKNDKKVRLYPIGIGKASTPTPVGYYSILEKETNPSWVDPGDNAVVIPSGESNPLGYRWMRIYGNYGIHGTNHPETIGHYVSNGCIRMNENEVEALFDMVSVDTPVEITYNRVVVEKIPDGNVVYYIYPDGYGRQPLDVENVSKWIAGFGVADFESDENIEQKIEASDGQPTYIGKPYALTINGQMNAGKAVIKDDVTYLPAVEVAKAIDVSLKWQPDAGVLVSTYGKATGYPKKNSLYFNADDVGVLFHLEGGLNTNDVYELHNAASAPAPSPKPLQTVVLNDPQVARTPIEPQGNEEPSARTNLVAAPEEVEQAAEVSPTTVSKTSNELR